MIMVCELLPSGKVSRFEYLESVPSPDGPIPVLALQWALPIARKLREMGRPCWIEKKGQPASTTTIDMDNRWKLRTAPATDRPN